MRRRQVSLLSSRLARRRIYRTTAHQIHLSPWEDGEQRILETISKHMEDKKATLSSKHGFMKGKSCWIDLISFYNEITRSLDGGRAVDIVYLDFNKAFSAVSHNIPTDKLLKNGLNMWTLTWAENWLNCQAQRIVTRGRKFS